MKILSPRVHGILDYASALGLLVLARAWPFSRSPRAASMFSAAGSMVLAQSALTNYPMGLLKAMPFRMHLMNDYVLGTLMAASPFLMGFRDKKRHYTWLPHVVIGAYVLISTLMTRRES